MTLSGNVDLLAARVGTEVKAVRTEFVPKTLFDAKGDQIVGSADNTPSKVSVGADGRLWMADAASAAGMKWATPAEVKAALAYTPSDIGAQPSGSYQTSDQDLTDFAALSPTNNDFLQRKSGAWTNRTPTQAKVDLDAVTSRGMSDALMQKSVYNDIISTGPRHLTGSAVAMSASIRTIQFLLGWVPSGTVVTGLRLMRSVAQATGTMQIAIYGDSSLSSTSWTRQAANFSGVMSGTGMPDTAYGFTAASDMYLRVMMVLTSAPGTYPTLLWLPGLSTLAGIRTSGGHPIQVNSNATTAPGATLDPSSTTGEANLLPMFALY